MMLIVGATGLLGFEICRLLREEGQNVRGLTRPGSPREKALRDIGVDIAAGDLKDPTSLRLACRGAKTVITTATATTSRRAGDSLKTVDRDGQLALIGAAQAEGVERFVYVSLSPLTRSTYFVDIKRRVESAVRASGLEWVILQPSAFMEIWLSPRIGWDIERGKVRITGKGDRQVSLISLHDVARFAILAALDRRTTNRNLDLGGPEALSPLEIVELLQRIMGRTVRVQHFPVGMLRAMAALSRPISRIQSELMRLGANSAEDGDSVDMTATLRSSQ